MTLPNPLTHILTHPSTQPPIQTPIGGGVSTNHKSPNRIELSQLGPDLIRIFTDLTWLPPPWGVGGGWSGYLGGWK